MPKVATPASTFLRGVVSYASLSGETNVTFRPAAA